MKYIFIILSCFGVLTACNFEQKAVVIPDYPPSINVPDQNKWMGTGIDIFPDNSGLLVQMLSTGYYGTLPKLGAKYTYFLPPNIVVNQALDSVNATNNERLTYINRHVVKREIALAEFSAGGQVKTIGNTMIQLGTVKPETVNGVRIDLTKHIDFASGTAYVIEGALQP